MADPERSDEVHFKSVAAIVRSHSIVLPTGRSSFVTGRSSFVIEVNEMISHYRGSNVCLALIMALYWTKVWRHPIAEHRRGNGGHLAPGAE
jgi:hypothetical protein